MTIRENVREKPQISELEIYSNSAGNNLQFKCNIDTHKYKIFYIESKIVLQGNGAKTNIDISQLLVGEYIFKVYDVQGNSTSHKNFIKN